MKISPKLPIWKKDHGDTISLCMIMKNEQARLQRCLDSVKGLVSEVIICDTGSTDNSIEIAHKAGALVMHDPWRDDFARPRNISVAAAESNWILIMDPDEVLSHQDHDKIREHTLHPEIIAYRMDTRNYTSNPMQQGARPNPMDFSQSSYFNSFVPSTKTRLFQNWKGIQFRGVWHELVDYDINEKKYPYAMSTVQIHHYPHEICQKSAAEKQALYLRLGEKKVCLNPDDDQAWWELAVAEHIQGYNERAYISALMSMRKGAYDPERLFFLSSVAKALGRTECQKLTFEKAICILFKNLTHISEDKKTPLHLPKSTAAPTT